MSDENKSFIESAYQAHYKSLWGYVYYLSSNPHLTDDIVQTTFLNLLHYSKKMENLMKFRGFHEKQLRAYLNVMANHLYFKQQNGEKTEDNAVSHLKLVAKEKQLQDGTHFIEQIINRNLLNELMTVLTEREKDIIFLAYDLDLKRSNIATMLGVTDNNIYVTIHTALKKMKRKIEQQGDGGGFEQKRRGNYHR